MFRNASPLDALYVNKKYALDRRSTVLAHETFELDAHFLWVH